MRTERKNKRVAEGIAARWTETYDDAGKLVKKTPPTYRVRVPDGRDANGERQWWCDTFDRLEDAKTAIRQRHAQQVSGTAVSRKQGRRILADLLDEWLETVQTSSLARNTHKMYEWAIRVWLKPELGQTTLEGLDTATIQKFYTRLVNGARRDGEPGKVSSSTGRRIHATLHRALEYAVDMQYLPRNPASRAKAPSDHNPKIICWTPEEVTAFIDTTRSHPDWPIWLLTLNTGLREAEIAGLRWKDIKGQTLTVQRQVCAYAGEGLKATDKTKSKAGCRTLALTTNAQTALGIQETRQKFQRSAAGPAWKEEGYIFTDAKGGPLNPNDMARRFKRAASKVPGITPITFHKLRHTCVTMLLAGGADLKTVAQVVGHADPGFTARRYGEVQQHMIDRAAQALQAMMGSVTG